LGYFWASFDRLLGANFHADLAIPLATRVAAIEPVAANRRTGWTGCGNPG